MSGKKITYYTLTAFIIGCIVLTYVQLGTSRNITALIDGNQQLLGEFKINDELKILEKNIFSIESNIRGVISTSDMELYDQTDLKTEEIHQKIDSLYITLDDPKSKEHLVTLDTLVNRKLEWGQLLLKTYKETGKSAAENLIGTKKGLYLTDSISTTIQKIEQTRKDHLSATIVSIDERGQKAKFLNAMLIIGLLGGAAVFLWYTINNSRNQAILIRDLHISERKVKESAQIKERFLANMSHEIRTPLNAIIGFINLLQKKRLDTESADYVDTIRKSSENLLSIVNDILDLSKIESHMMRVEIAPFSMRGLVHSVQNMFIPKAKEKNIQIIAEIDPDLPDVMEGDPTKLTQILVNLLGNAIKFTPSGTITIKIKNNGISGNTIMTGITVADTGIGIEQDKLGHIFERFSQAEDSVNRHYGGTGLGLTIVSELITLQNGTIRVESTPGEGTTFHITMPYTISDEAIDGQTGKSQDIVHDFNAIKLLVVEDNEINQKLVKHLFKNWGLAFDLANNGLEAIEALKANQYNMVLMDIQMPEMDGYTATQVIRDELKLDIPIVAMTAHAFAGEREKCLNNGMNDYISKPLREDKLYALIAKFAKFKPNGTGTSKSENIAGSNAAFKYASLDYLQEISGGDTEHQKMIIGIFISQLPEELAALEAAFETDDTEKLKGIAHNLKTTISIMGLNKHLQPMLDAIEYDNLPKESVARYIEQVLLIANESLKEIQDFHAKME